ncbi:MAG TPA: amidohydrolase family protein [Gemmatimonadales bacterium]|nr:amidohydrolase family protein [Gemmatimonadales bacterium]
MLRALIATVLLVANVARAQAARSDRFDLLITGGRILDGTGNPWYYADVGIRGGKVAEIGRLAGRDAGRVIDAKDRVVAPGFIDIHSHADDGATPRGGFRDPDPARRAAPNLVTQGVTTVVVNQDGRSPLPISEQRDLLAKNGIGPNAVLLVGHGSVRARVMGSDFRRLATADEVKQMKGLVRQAMAQGAWGLSAGLEYMPGRWSNTDEVVALAEEIAPYRGVYISHERSEGQDPMWYWPSQDPPGQPTLLDAVRETIEIGERSGATVVASHIKAKGQNYWGSSGAAIQLIERARARGVDVWADQYSYATSGTDGNTVLIPGWAIGAGEFGQGRSSATDYAAALRKTLADSAQAMKLRRDIAHEIARRGGAARVVVFEYPDSAIVGKSIGDIAAARKLEPVEAAIGLQLEGDVSRPGGGRMRGFSMDEVDLEAFAARPWVATASDAGIALPEDGPSTHARYYGTFSRKIRHYALDRGVISLEDAIRSMTTLPAQIMGIRDRGILREGAWADVVVFDPARIRDAATFFQPHQYTEGVDYVLVNGEFVVDEGRITGKLAGKVLTR